MPPSSNRNAAHAAKIERDRADVARDRDAVAQERADVAQERAALEVAKADFAVIVGEFLEHVDALVAARGPAIPEGHEPVTALVPRALPSTICLTASFGFSENGVLKHWPPGRAITNAADIALLFERKAPIEGYDNE